MAEQKTSIQIVKDALAALGYDFPVLEFSQSISTAQQAADAIGASLPQIAKSLVFKCEQTGQPILIITSGANRVDTRLVAGMIGEKLLQADADFVHQHTGFTVGGVPPLGHANPIRTYIDRDLLKYDHIWAAAGSPHAVFRLDPQALLAMTDGQVITVK